MAQLIVKVIISTSTSLDAPKASFYLTPQQSIDVTQMILSSGISPHNLVSVIDVLTQTPDKDKAEEIVQRLTESVIKIVIDGSEATAGGLAVEAPPSPPDHSSPANMLTADLGLEVRIQNRLVMAGYNTVQHILDAREEDILAIPGFDNSDFVVLKLALLGKNLMDPNSRLEQSSNAHKFVTSAAEDQPPKDKRPESDTTTIIEGSGLEITELQLKGRVVFPLLRVGYTHVNQLLARTEEQLRFRGFGKGCLNQLEAELLRQGLLDPESPLGRSYHARILN